MKRIRRRGSLDRPVYEAETRGIVVRVVAAYEAEQSDPLEGRWFWSYVVEIENHSGPTVQLLSRHWTITDALNRTEEIKGVGVVGEQPTLRPRDAFRYTSGCPLPTPSGWMRGTYLMVAEDGEQIDVEIPQFSLDLPGAKRTVN